MNLTNATRLYPDKDSRADREFLVRTPTNNDEDDDEEEDEEQINEDDDDDADDDQPDGYSV